MLSKTRQRQFEITIEITNNRTEDTVLIVKDRIPTSQHEDVKVSHIELTPEVKQRTKLNICTWKMVLKPQDKKKIVQRYEIEHPVDVNVSGI